MEYGLRAAFIILRRYIRRYRKDTVPAIIRTWAPETENKTQRYIDVVCSMSGIPHDAQINYADKVTMCKLVASMAYVENGQNIEMKTIEKGYDLA